MVENEINKSDLIIRKAKTRFFWFSILGVICICFVSIFAFRYHGIVVDQQKLTQELYGLVSKQFVLINKVSNMSEEFSLNLSKSQRIALKENFKKTLDQLETEKNIFNRWMIGSNFTEIQSVSLILEKKNIDDKMNDFIFSARNLIDGKYDGYSDIKKIIRRLTKSSSSGLGETFGELNLKIKKIQDDSLNNLHNTGTGLLILSIFQVVFAWVLIFKPLYSMLFTQQNNMREALLKARSANRSKTEFLTNISHEIRTPMTAILGYADLLSNENLTRKDLQNNLNIINQNANHLLGLIDEILDISKIEAGKFELNNEKVELFKVLNEVYSLIEIKAIEKKIDLKFHNKGDLPEEVVIDKKRFKQILFNVLGNAIKFTDKGFVDLTVSYNKQKDNLVLVIKDTGCGISKEQQDCLFNPFQQADMSIARNFGGAGLGLSLSRGIAKKMKGTVKILDSKENYGTTMLIRIKANTPQGVEMDNRYKSKKIINKDQVCVTGRLYNKNILLVDDAVENAELFKIYLKQAGASVTVAYNGEDALRIAEQQKDIIDIILLDLQMPGKDGFQVIKELNENKYPRPVIALTAHAMEEEKIKTKNAGFDGHITKPVNADVLVNQISNLIH